MVRYERTVALQVLNKQQHFLEQAALVEWVEFAALRLLEQRRAREQREPTRAHDHGVRLAEHLRGVDGVLAAVRCAGHAVQERVPVANPRLVQLGALLQDVGGMVALVDALERPVVAALSAHADLAHAEVPQRAQLLDGLVAEVGHAPRAIDVLDLGQVLVDLLQDGSKPVVRQRERVGGKQLNGARVRVGRGKLSQVGLDGFHVGHAEAHALVHRAELALVVRAAARDLEQRPRGPIGIAVNRFGEMHGVVSFSSCFLD